MRRRLSHPCLPFWSASLTFILPNRLLNKKSIVAIGDQAPRGNYGGPFGMPHLPALGTFGRAPVPEGSIEDRKIQQRDFTDAKVVFDTFFRRSECVLVSLE